MFIGGCAGSTTGGLKIFRFQNKNHYALVNNQYKKIFKNKKFSSRLIIPKILEFRRIKHKISNNYFFESIV